MQRNWKCSRPRKHQDHNAVSRNASLQRSRTRPYGIFRRTYVAGAHLLQHNPVVKPSDRSLLLRARPVVSQTPRRRVEPLRSRFPTRYRAQGARQVCIFVFQPIPLNLDPLFFPLSLPPSVSRAHNQPTWATTAAAWCNRPQHQTCDVLAYGVWFRVTKAKLSAS